MIVNKCYLLVLRRRDFRRLIGFAGTFVARGDVKGKCFQLELLAQNSQHFLVSLWRAPLRPRRTAQVYGRHCLSHPCRFSASDLEREPRERKDKGSYSRTRLRGFVEHDMPIGRNGKPRTSQAVHVGAHCVRGPRPNAWAHSWTHRLLLFVAVLTHW